MSDISPIFEQLRQLVDQHVPPDVLSKAVPAAVLCLLAGVGLSVLGAKLARFGSTAAFLVLGGVAGAYFGREFSYPPPLCALIGAVMIGVVGHLTFRLWVGVAAAVVLSSLALGVFGYHRVVPHVSEFQQGMVTWSPVDGPTEFSVPSPKQQQAYLDRSPGQWVEGLWAHVTAKDAQVERHGKALALAALITGLCLGVIAMRWTLILMTSLVGTALVTTAAASLFTHAAGGSYQAFADQPGIIGIAVGGFLATSLIVQALLTRKAPSAAAQPTAKS